MPLLTAGPSRFLGGGASGWWAVSGATCVAAYQPKGAADLATSYINWANPGTYNAAPGVAPTFDPATGWTHNGTTQYLTTGVMPDATWTIIVRFSNVTNGGYLAGVLTSAIRFGIVPNASSQVGYHSGNPATAQQTKSPQLTGGVLAIAGANCYRDGVSDATIVQGSSTVSDTGMSIGGRNAGGTPGSFIAAIIQAVAIYNTVLTAGQVAAVSAAMAAL